MLIFARKRGYCGSLLCKKTNEHEKTAAELPENEENRIDFRFRWASNLLIGLRNHCSEQQMEVTSSSSSTKKNYVRNQKMTERVGW